MSNQLRLFIFIVVISGALCTVQDYVIMSQCAHNKAIYLAPEGKVSVTDIPMTQNITIAGTTDFLSTQVFKITLYAKETQMYLCFNNHWKLVGMKRLQETCYFNESIVHGYFEYRSAVDPNRRVGFTHRGKAIGPKKNVTDACYFFTKIEADRFFHQYTDAFNQKHHHHHHTSPPSSSSTQRLPSGKSAGKLSSSSSLSPSKASSLVGSGGEGGASSERSGQSSRGRNRGGVGKESILGGTGAARNRGSATANRQPNGHNSNLSNSSTSNSRRGNINLSSTNINHRNHHNHNNSHNNNVQQQPATQLHNIHQHSQSAQHHQVRHHHNNPNFIARRQQYQREHKLRRLRNHQQQQSTKHMQRMTPEVSMPEPVSSPMSPELSSISSLSLSMAGSSPIAASVLPSPTLVSDDAVSVMSGRRKGKRRKNGSKVRQQPLVNAKDLKHRRASKQQQKLSSNSSTSPTASTEDYLPSAASPPLPSASLTTVEEMVSSSMSSADVSSSSKVLATSTYTSPTSDYALSSDPSPTSLIDEIFSSSPITSSIEPLPSTQSELFASSSIDPWSTTSLDDASLSSSSSSSSSSLDELSPTPQLVDDLMMVMESVGNDETGGTSTSTDDNSSSSSSSTDSIDSSNSSDDTSDSSSSTIDSTVSYRNHNDEYSNDDASAMPVLPNNLDNSMTEYLYSTSSSNRHRNINSSNFKKYYHNVNMGSEKLNRSKKLQTVNVNAGGSSVTSTIATTTTNHRNNNIRSYLNNNNNNNNTSSRETNSNSYVDILSSTERTTTTSSNFDENVTNSNNNNQHSSYFSTSSTKINKNLHNSNLLDSETKKYYNKKYSTTTISTTTTHHHQLATTIASASTPTVTTIAPSKTILMPTPSFYMTAYKKTTNNSGNSKPINVNNFYAGQIIESTYDAIDDDDIISGGGTMGSGGKIVAVGYLPTTSSLSVLPESIRIAKIKINRERRNRLRRKLHIGS